jgi:hypothetical protein
MSDLERNLRAARESLPEPDGETTDRARAAAVAAVPEPAVRRRRRLGLTAVVFAAAVAGAFVAGLALAPGGATKLAADGPGFLPARGWSTYQTGLTTVPAAPMATAATARLGDDVLIGTFPWQTVRALRAGEVLLQAVFYPAGEVASVDARFPHRRLPLSFADGWSEASLEGQPPNVAGYRLRAGISGYNVELYAFFGGGRASTAARSAADAELSRLVVPQAPAHLRAVAPNSRAPRGACRPADLRANVFLNGATGSLLGGISLVNASSKPCTLRGEPTVRLRDAAGVLLSTHEVAVKPLWRQLGQARPSGWPTVRLSPRGRAAIFLQLRNWCVTPAKPVYFHVRLPRAAQDVIAPARVTLRCDDPHSPVSLAIGPVEPPTR